MNEQYKAIDEVAKQIMVAIDEADLLPWQAIGILEGIKFSIAYSSQVEIEERKLH